jgi:hypothetical protein
MTRLGATLVAVLRLWTGFDRRGELSCHQGQAGVRGHHALVTLSRAIRALISGKCCRYTKANSHVLLRAAPGDPFSLSVVPGTGLTILLPAMSPREIGIRG